MINQIQVNMIFAAEEMQESFEEWNEYLHVITYDLTRASHPVSPEDLLRPL